jgi:hypothetical protein
MFVPSLAVAIAGIPTVAPVTVAVPEAQAPTKRAPPPIDPVVPVIMPEVAPKTHTDALQLQAYPVELSVYVLPETQEPDGAPLPFCVDVPGSWPPRVYASPAIIKQRNTTRTGFSLLCMSPAKYRSPLVPWQPPRR